MMENPKIGDLRWRVMLALEVQTEDTADAGYSTSYGDQRYVYADIQPVGTATYLMGTQEEVDAITHRIFIRYQHDLTEFHLIIRQRPRPDKTTVQEVYRIHRLAEVNGRERYLCLDCELRGDK